jgi:hypothetical protein
MVEAWERLSPEERGTFLRGHDVTMRFRHLPGDDPWASVLWGYLDQMKAALAAQ